MSDLTVSDFDLPSMQRTLQSYQNDASLLLPDRLAERLQALKFVALLHELARTQRQQPAWMTLQQSAQQLAKQCTAANQALFAQLRDDLRQGRCSPRELRAQLDRFTAYQPKIGRAHV